MHGEKLSDRGYRRYPFARGGLRSKPMVKMLLPLASDTIIVQPDKSWIKGSHIAALISRT